MVVTAAVVMVAAVSDGGGGNGGSHRPLIPRQQGRGYAAHALLLN